MYFALIYSLLQYELEVLDGAFDNSIGKLFITQKYILRINIFKYQNDHTAQVFKTLHMLPIKYFLVLKFYGFFSKRAVIGELRISYYDT